MRDKISGWIRQSRHRAKKHNVTNNLKIHAVHELLDSFNNLCAYCGMNGETLNHQFLLSCGAPNVIANILPICQNCKLKKGTTDLVTFYNNGNITNDKFMELLKKMLERDGGPELREYIKGITGIGL